MHDDGRHDSGEHDDGEDEHSGIATASTDPAAAENIPGVCPPPSLRRPAVTRQRTTRGTATTTSPPGRASVLSSALGLHLTTRSGHVRPEFAHMEMYPEREEADFDAILQRAIGAHHAAHAIPIEAPQDEAQLDAGVVIPSNRTTRGMQSASRVAIDDTPFSDEESRQEGGPPPPHGGGGARAPVTAGGCLDTSVDDYVVPAGLRQRGRGTSYRMAKRFRDTIIARHKLLTPAELRAEIDAATALHVSIPLLYPQNLIAWSHMRYAAHDFGRSYSFRIQLFTGFFAAFVAATVVFLIFITAKSPAMTIELQIAIAVACATELVFGFALSAQVVQGARINYEALEHERRLNRIESLAYEYLATAHSPLPPLFRDRMLQVKKVASAIVEGIIIEERLNPAKVMGIPANIGLLSTFASVSLSGLLAAYQNLSKK